MYGLWLFKEIQTEYGYCKVEILRKGYSGSQIEIGALAANSLTIALENLGSITDPIGKSVCSFSIIDTEQISYDDFFTPDATALKVVVSTKVGGGAYVTRWSGYVTPDFFAENLTYRTPISISARDNIGYLNDVDFDMVATTTTVRNLITYAFAKTASAYPMNVVFATEKQTAEGILAIDAVISTALLVEGSWYEALEVVLHDLGLQMRWVDNNTIAVMDLSQIPEYYATQSFDFIHASGYREILPAWRELSQSQDFGLRENFFDSWLNENNIAYVKTEAYSTPEETYAEVRYYAPQNWQVKKNIYTTNPRDYNNEFGNKIYFSATNEDDPSTTYMSWSVGVQSSSIPLTIKCNALNTVVYPYKGGLRKYDPFLIGGARGLGDFLQIGIKANLFLHTASGTYVMRNDWEADNGTGSGSYINYTLDKVVLEGYDYIEGKGSFPKGVQPSEKQITLVANTIPYDGVLEFRIYGYYIVDYKFKMEETGWNPHFDKFFTVIDNLTFTFNNGDAQTGVDTNVSVGDVHNVKSAESYVFGQIPANAGGINAYAGGLYNAADSMSELIGFQRNSSGSNYNLLELVGREIIHFNKKNYNKLSGTIKNLDKEPLMFNKLFVREGKTYAPFAYSLNVISNEMEVTTMQEVEPYTTESFTQIVSALTTGGATVGGGNNTVLQYSEEAGNVKRVFELDPATEEEQKDAYLLIDNNNFPEAKKIHISQVNNFWDIINVGTEEEPVWAVMPKDKDGKEVGIVTKSFITFGGLNSESTEGGVGGLTTFDIYVGNNGPYPLQDGKVNLPAYPVMPTDYASISWVDENFTPVDAHNTLSQRVTALENSGTGGGSGGTTSVVSYNPSVLTGKLLGTLTINGVDNKIYAPAIPTKLSAFTNDEGYVTEDWVNEQGFLTEEQDISHLLSKTEAANTYQPKGNYVTENALNGKGYLTQSDAEDTYQPKGDYAVLDDLNSYLLASTAKNTYATIQALNAATLRIDTLETTLVTEQDYIDILQGYFTNGKANKAIADGDGNNIVDTYATKAALKDVADKVASLQDMWSFDEAHANTIKTIYNVVVDEAISFGGYGEGPTSGGGGLTAFNVVVNGVTYSSSGATVTVTEKLATQSALTTLSNKINGYDSRLTALENLWHWSDEHNAVETDHDVVVEKAISFGGYGEGNSGSGGITTVTKDMVISALGYTPYNAANPNGYATQTWVENQGYLTNTSLSNYVDLASVQEITGVKTFVNGIKIGSTLLSEKTNNNTKYVELDGDLVVKGSISFGGYGESSGSSSSGGLTQFKVVVNGQTYTSQGDTVTISEQFAKSSALSLYQLTSTAINTSNIGSQSVSYANNAGALQGKTFGQWDGIAYNGGGVLEVGKYIDFHNSASSTADYDTRIVCGGATGNKLTLPTASGTLALTSQFADYQPLSTAINTGNIGSQSVNYANSAGKLSSNSAYTAWGQTFFSNGVPLSISGALSNVTSIDASGTATIDAIVVSSTSAKAHLTFSRSGINYFATASSGGAFGFICGGNSIQTVNADLVIEEGYLYPGSTGATRLGRSSKRWSSVYSVDGDFSGSVSMGGNLVVSGSITFGSASDRRLKEDIQSMSYEQALSVVMALNPVIFKWNTTANELGKLNGISDGFIADEYEALIPNSGRAIWANYRAIDYTRAIPYVTAVVQNHETRVQKLERRVKELENELKQYRRV